jgi:soluble lytic murein transglycosylase-like protein
MTAYADIIQEAAERYNLSPEWIAAVVSIESGFDAAALPRWEPHIAEHSYGLGQFLPSTVLWVIREPELFPLTAAVRGALLHAAAALPFQGEKKLNALLLDPTVGIHLIGAYLRYLLNRYDQNIVDAVAAYNAGSVRKKDDGTYVNQWHVDKFLTALDKIRGV